ncbi:MAG: hypothetical protein QOJ30_2629 [Pseudonocardiales bacterium]|nr:hypothetical protein [Pseudonocardiales bacterium]
MRLNAQVSVPDVTPASSSALADELVTTLGQTLRIVKTPMIDAVARLDTCGPNWVLYLDSTCPPEDQCWALHDVLRVLELGLTATRWAIPAPHLRLLGDSTQPPNQCRAQQASDHGRSTEGPSRGLRPGRLGVPGARPSSPPRAGPRASLVTLALLRGERTGAEPVRDRAADDQVAP